VSFSGSGITVNSVNPNPAGTELTVSISISSTATVGARSVTVRNSDGGTTTAAGAFTVNARPNITGVTPASKARGQSTSVTITGTFAQGTWTPSMVVFSLSGGGTNGITVTAVSVNPAGTQLTVNMTIAGNASRSQRHVTVTNPDGGTHTRQNGFRVT
jgi:hypothetical protein